MHAQEGRALATNLTHFLGRNRANGETLNLLFSAHAKQKCTAGREPKALSLSLWQPFPSNRLFSPGTDDGECYISGSYDRRCVVALANQLPRIGPWLPTKPILLRRAMQILSRNRRKEAFHSHETFLRLPDLKYFRIIRVHF